MHNPELVKFYFGITSTYSTKIMFCKTILKEEVCKNRNAEKHKTEDDFDFKVFKFKYYTFGGFSFFALIVWIKYL
jgi:hypothetical protein